MSTDYARLRVLAEAAAPGPWTGNVVRVEKDADGKPRGPGVIRDANGSIVVLSANGPEILVADATYIAAIDPPTLIALLDEIERLRGDAEWEYECKIPSSDLAVEHDWTPVADRTHGMNCTGKMRRRRKAGPWEPVEGETDD